MENKYNKALVAERLEITCPNLYEKTILLFALSKIFTAYVTELFNFNEVWKIDLMDFMEQNYTEDLTLEEFASYTGRSLATFKRDFAEIGSLPPPKCWIMEHRLEKAKRMLLEEGVSAHEVGYMVGFKNRSHFSQAFKKQYGYAPANYLKLNRENFI